MDAAERISAATPPIDNRAPLRLLRCVSPETSDAVTDTFLGGARAGPAREHAPVRVEPAQVEPKPARAAPEQPRPFAPPAPARPAESESSGMRPLRLRCPLSPSVAIGVERTGRICLEVRVGGGVDVSRILTDLDQVERWLHASPHAAAINPVAARIDLSCPVRRRVVVTEGADEFPERAMGRAGIEVCREPGCGCGAMAG